MEPAPGAAGRAQSGEVADRGWASAPILPGAVEAQARPAGLVGSADGDDAAGGPRGTMRAAAGAAGAASASQTVRAGRSCARCGRCCGKVS